jgi:hypothetical protein
MLITHSIGDITVQTTSDIAFNCWQTRRFQRFEDHGGHTPDLQIRLQGVESHPFMKPDPEDVPLLAQFTHHPENTWKTAILRAPAVRARLRAIQDRSAHIGLEMRPSSVTIFDFMQRELDIFYAADQGVIDANCCIGSSLFAPLAAALPAALLHSASVIIDQRAMLFLAPDEGGKTTAAALAPRDAAILCDDQNLVRQSGERLIVYGTPWGRYFNSVQSAPLAGLFYLEQSPSFELIPLNPAQALQALWGDHRTIYLCQPHPVKACAFNFLARLCRSVPVYRLRFPKDYINWEAVYDVTTRPVYNAWLRAAS